MECSLKGRREERETNNSINSIINKSSLLFKSLDCNRKGRRQKSQQLLLSLIEIKSKSSFRRCPVPGTVTNETSNKQQLQFNNNHFHSLSPLSSRPPPSTAESTGSSRRNLFITILGNKRKENNYNSNISTFQPSNSRRRHLITIPTTRGVERTARRRKVTSTKASLEFANFR